MIKLSTSYLKERYHYVTYNDFRSQTNVPVTVVPQVSNLRPLPFITAISHVNSNKQLMYLDDSKIYKQMKDRLDCVKYQGTVSAVIREVEKFKKNKANFTIQGSKKPLVWAFIFLVTFDCLPYGCNICMGDTNTRIRNKKYESVQKLHLK